jgi:hypothetical protein
MTDVIEFPSKQVEADFLPQAGDRYQAYGLCHKFKPFMVAFVFPNWSMEMFPYSRQGTGSFRILNDKRDGNGDAEITLTFGTIGGFCFYEIIITGCNILDLFQGLGDQVVKWVWEMPKERAAVKEGEPVIHSIEIREKASNRPVTWPAR